MPSEPVPAVDTVRDEVWAILADGFYDLGESREWGKVLASNVMKILAERKLKVVRLIDGLVRRSS